MDENKKKYLKFGIIIFAVILVTGLIGKFIGLYNTEIALRNQIIAKQTDNQSSFDNMWKKIKQAANVSDKYKDGFKEVLEAYTTGRQDASSQMLMKWGNEAVPNLDSSVYKQINNIIVASRDDFTANQRELIDLNREHDILLDTFPNNICFKIMGIKKIDIKVVTSTKTDEAFETRKDDDIEL